MERRFDVVGIGNALVDVIAHEPDALVDELEMIKGAMNLVDEERSLLIRSRLENPHASCGGAAANTMAGVASFGGSAAYLGKIRDDALGDIFAADLAGLGVTFTTPRATTGGARAAARSSSLPTRSGR